MIKPSFKIFVALFIVAYSIISFFAERVNGGEWASWNHALGLILFLFYLKLNYNERNALFFTSFYFIFYIAGMLASAAIIAGGAFMFEIAEFGTPNGIFWIILIYFLLGFESSAFGYRLGGTFHAGLNVKKLNWRHERFFTYLVTSVALTLSLYVLIAYKGPIILDINRVTFWTNHVPSYLRLLPLFIAQSFFFAAFYFLWNKKEKKNFNLSLLIICAYLLSGYFVLGEKFTFYIFFGVIFLAILPGVYPQIKLKTTHIFKFALVLLLLFALVLFVYLSQGKDAGFVLVRIALQAQLLWSVFSETVIPLAPNKWYCFFGCGGFFSGADYISFKYLPIDTYLLYVKGGTRLSGFMPALPIITLGVILSLIFHVITFVFLGFIQRKFLVAVSEKNLIYSYLLFEVYFSAALIWLAAAQSSVPRLMLAICIIICYRLAFPAFKSNHSSFKMA